MEKHEKNYTFTKEESKEKLITLNVKVNSERFVAEKEHVYGHLAETVTITGFRPGKAPRALIEAQISDKLFTETINHLLPEVTSEILESEKLNPMNQVKYDLVKFSDAEGLEYKASFISYPEVKLGDFTKIKAVKETKEISEKDVEAEVEKIMKYYTKPAKTETEGQPEQKEDKPVELTDDTVAALGLGFSTVVQLKDQVKKELTAASERDSETKWLQSIIDEAEKISKIEVPKALVTESVTAREQDYLKKLQDLNLKLEEFLKMQNTTIEKLREDWEKEAMKKFADELLLLEIIKDQKFVVTDADVETEIGKVADEKLKADLATNEGRRYLITVLLQQRAIEWLRAQVQK